LARYPEKYFSTVPELFDNTMGNAAGEVDSFLKQKDFFTFSFVRHPYHRLVSAFEDKV